MSAAGKKQEQAQPQTVVQEKDKGLLDQMLDVMPAVVQRDVGRDLIQSLVDQATQGSVIWDRSVTRTINKAIEQLDQALSKQLAAVMHCPEFLKLEGTWRGLHYFVMNSETSAMLKLRLLNISKRELFKDLDKAIEFDQSQVFKAIYEEEYGSPGGEPYGALIGDYEFTNHPEDIDILQTMGGVAGAAVAALHRRRVAFLNGIVELRRPVAAARPREHLSQQGLHQMERVPRLGGFAFRLPHHAPRFGAASVRSGNEADRGIRVRRGGIG